MYAVEGWFALDRTNCKSLQGESEFDVARQKEMERRTAVLKAVIVFECIVCS